MPIVKAIRGKENLENHEPPSQLIDSIQSLQLVFELQRKIWRNLHILSLVKLTTLEKDGNRERYCSNLLE